MHIYRATEAQMVFLTNEIHFELLEQPNIIIYTGIIICCYTKEYIDVNIRIKSHIHEKPTLSMDSQYVEDC